MAKDQTQEMTGADSIILDTVGNVKDSAQTKYDSVRKQVRMERITYLTKERESQHVRSTIASIMSLQATVDHSHPDDLAESTDHQSMTARFYGVTIQAYGDESTDSAMLYEAKKGKHTSFEDCAKAAAVICDYAGHQTREHEARSAADKTATAHHVDCNRDIKHPYERLPKDVAVRKNEVTV